VLRAQPAPLDFPHFTDAHPALVVHGSGSSGNPKAVLMSQGDLLRFFEYHDFVYSQYSEEPDQLIGTSAIVTGLPTSHLAGLANCLQGLMSGRRTCLLSFFLPEMYLKLVEEMRCAFILLVPSLYRSLLKEPYLRTMDRSALRFCITGGEPCPPELVSQVEHAFGVPLVTGYSMTECLSGLGHLRRDLFARDIKPGSCGRPIFGEVKLCDRQGGESSREGELWVRNATVHECYLDPELNERHLRGGWFRTGDLFFRDADGCFFHRGRVDDMFICNGKNIYPVELETLLMRHPAIEMACAAPVSTAQRGTVPGALIVARQAVSHAEIQEFSMKFGPSHAIPQVVKVVDALPQLGPGKVDRRRAAELLQEHFDQAHT
jgi:acyl-CoA synthetase (AMP-forming)/AMP-acid ligase II